MNDGNSLTGHTESNRRPAAHGASAASVYHAEACTLCGSHTWIRLPDPGPQSLASDLRIVAEPLGKIACEACAIAMRPPSSTDTSTFYDAGYTLYAHGPGAPIEQSRQSQYAQWIAASIPGAPARVLDVGCGNGSLLAALRERWPRTEFFGCDPSAEAIEHAPSGLRVWQGTSDTLPGDIEAELIVSVNVIEHTRDPVRFVRDLLRAGRTHATLALVCPNGEAAGVELLFADHLWSLTPAHLRAIVLRAGLHVRGFALAPRAIGDFQMVIASGSHSGSEIPIVDAGGVNRARAAFLDDWRVLDDWLLPRLADRVVCFGLGEAAGLLRAYAPRSWERVSACTADAAPPAGSFSPLPVLPLDAIRASATMLVAVRPADQAAVAARLRERFAHVVTWYDLAGGRDR